MLYSLLPSVSLLLFVPPSLFPSFSPYFICSLLLPTCFPQLSSFLPSLFFFFNFNLHQLPSFLPFFPLPPPFFPAFLPIVSFSLPPCGSFLYSSSFFTFFFPSASFPFSSFCPCFLSSVHPSRHSLLILLFLFTTTSFTFLPSSSQPLFIIPSFLSFFSLLFSTFTSFF